MRAEQRHTADMQGTAYVAQQMFGSWYHLEAKIPAVTGMSRVLLPEGHSPTV